MSFSAVIFGNKKQMQAQHGKEDLERKIKDTERKKETLHNKVIELNSKIEAIERRNAERRKVDTSRREVQIQLLTQQREHLENFIDTIKTK